MITAKWQWINRWITIIPGFAHINWQADLPSKEGKVPPRNLFLTFLFFGGFLYFQLTILEDKHPKYKAWKNTAISLSPQHQFLVSSCNPDKWEKQEFSNTYCVFAVCHRIFAVCHSPVFCCCSALCYKIPLPLLILYSLSFENLPQAPVRSTPTCS